MPIQLNDKSKKASPCRAAFLAIDKGHGIANEFGGAVCAAVSSKTSEANLYMAFKWFARARDLVQANYETGAGVSVPDSWSILNPLRPMGIVSDKLALLVSDWASDPRYKGGGPSMEGTLFLTTARDLFAAAYESRRATAWSAGGLTGPMSEASCTTRLSTPPAPEANDAVMSTYDKQFACGLLSWPYTTDAELNFAIAVWQAKVPPWPTAVRLAQEELARRAKKEGGIEDNVPPPKSQISFVPNPLTENFCMANLDDGVPSAARGATCGLLVNPATTVDALRVIADAATYSGNYNLAIMALEQSKRAGKGGVGQGKPPLGTPVTLCAGVGLTPPAGVPCCDGLALQDGKCAPSDVAPKDEGAAKAETNWWAWGLATVGVMGLAGLGVYAVTRGSSARANPILKPMSGYAYEYDGKYWKTGPNDDWETVVFDPTGDEKFVGTRTIDGYPCNVWSSGSLWIAQTQVST